MLYMCLGQHDSADLRAPRHASEGDEILEQTMLEAISRKRKRHDFVINRPQRARHGGSAYVRDGRMSDHWPGGSPTRRY
jgi:molybdenum cofactor biosynthesis enzyme MoaA